MDLDFPGYSEVDLSIIDHMVKEYMVKWFPIRYYSFAMPVFIFRTMPKVTQDDHKKARSVYHSRFTKVEGEYASYRGHKTVFDGNEYIYEAEIEPAQYYMNGKKTVDWRVRLGKMRNMEWIEIIADKRGNVGKKLFREKKYQWPFEDYIEKELSKFMDGNDIFNEEYGF